MVMKESALFSDTHEHIYRWWNSEWLIYFRRHIRYAKCAISFRIRECVLSHTHHTDIFYIRSAHLICRTAEAQFFFFDRMLQLRFGGLLIRPPYNSNNSNTRNRIVCRWTVSLHKNILSSLGGSERFVRKPLAHIACNLNGLIVYTLINRI